MDIGQVVVPRKMRYSCVRSLYFDLDLHLATPEPHKKNQKVIHSHNIDYLRLVF